MTNNSHLVSIPVQSLIEQFKAAKGNEKLMVEARLQATVDAIQAVLPAKAQRS